MAIESNSDTHTYTLGLYMEETKVNMQILLSHVNQLHRTHICKLIHMRICESNFLVKFAHQDETGFKVPLGILQKIHEFHVEVLQGVHWRFLYNFPYNRLYL